MSTREYYLEDGPFGYSIIMVDENGTVWGVPYDEGNADYQQYLKDTDGGLPLPTEEEK